MKNLLLTACLAFLSLSPAYAVAASPASAAAAAEAHTEAWRAYLEVRRATQLANLRAYAEAGSFPVNDDQPGLLNIFMDEEGRRCAMANLIWEDGEAALVRRTARTDNAVLLGEVTEGPLLDWILESGLTQEEVAFIQEPDFFIGRELPMLTQEQLISSEQQRLRAHFLAAAGQLEAYGGESIEVALDRLGAERLASAPPPAFLAAAAAAPPDEAEPMGWLR